MAERTFWQHWPALALGLAVAVIFGAALVVFQVRETEVAVVMRFGKPLAEAGGAVKIFKPGAHVKLPLIDEVWRHDGRMQCYDLRKGNVEQVQTADNFPVIVTTFVVWRVGEPVTYLKAVNTVSEAENKLDDLVRNGRNNVLGRHALSDLINTDPGKVRIPDVEKEILGELSGVAMEKYGIEVRYIGFRHIGFPEDVTMKVFERMRAERQRKSDAYRAEGARDAQKIRSEADVKVSRILSEAEAAGMQLRAEGDRTAAAAYAVFQKDPQLAVFLRKLEALRQAVDEKTTLILDTNTPPYDLLRPDAARLRPAAAPVKAATPEKK